jgi:hypothetical protein
MKYFIERHIQGFCIVDENGFSLAEGEPHMRGTMYFKSRKLAQEYIDHEV